LGHEISGSGDGESGHKAVNGFFHIVPLFKEVFHAIRIASGGPAAGAGNPQSFRPVSMERHAKLSTYSRAKFFHKLLIILMKP
jgi:hypothetical protein